MRSQRQLWIHRSVALAALAVMLSGCSSVPAAVNPVDWYRSARDVLTGHDEDKDQTADTSENGLSADRDKPAPGADEPIPSVNSVPDRPKTSSAAERQAVANSLVADQQGAHKYSGEVIKRQGELPPPPTAPRSTIASAPSAAAAAQMAQAPAPLPTQTPSPSIPPVSTPATAQETSSPNAPTPAQVAAAVPPPPPMTTPTPTSPVQPSQSTQQAATQQASIQPQIAPVPSSAPSSPAPLREVPSAATPQQAPGQPIQPANIVIPRENPTAPKLNEVKPYVPPAGLDGYQTVYVTGAPGAGGAGARSNVAPATIPAALTAGMHPLATYSDGSARGSYQVAIIQFGSGSSKLTAQDLAILRQVEAQHKQVGGTLRVVGHASGGADGRAEQGNMTVSADRAETVARELVQLGTQPEDIYVGGVGDNQPKYSEAKPTGAAGNRRTEIFIDF